MIKGAICYLKNGGETLFLYRDRGKDNNHRGFYTLPGGFLEIGEKSIDCVVREFEEETGLKLLDPRLRVKATFYTEGRLLGGKLKFDVYEANTFSGKLREEHPEGMLIWISDNKLPEIKIHGGDRKILELMRRRGVFEAAVRCHHGGELTSFEKRRID
jgi:8-oxo-dGTP diphosphatase